MMDGLTVDISLQKNLLHKGCQPLIRLEREDCERGDALKPSHEALWMCGCGLTTCYTCGCQSLPSSPTRHVLNNALLFDTSVKKDLLPV